MAEVGVLEPLSAFQSALAQLTRLHDQEVKALHMQVFQLQTQLWSYAKQLNNATSFSTCTPSADGLIQRQLLLNVNAVDGDGAGAPAGAAAPPLHPLSPCVWTGDCLREVGDDQLVTVEEHTHHWTGFTRLRDGGPAPEDVEYPGINFGHSLNSSSAPSGDLFSTELKTHAQDREYSGAKAERNSKSSCAGSCEEVARTRTTSSFGKKRRKRLMRRRSSKESTLLRVVENPAFDCLSAAMILVNSAIIGSNVVWQTSHTGEHFGYYVAGHLCSGFFLVELLLRMKAQGIWTFLFWCEGQYWNHFDLTLVLISIADLVLSRAVLGQMYNDIGSIGTGLKTMKMLRIVRVFRVFRFFRELNILALMIVDSMRSLAWAILLEIIIIYVFAIWFTQCAIEHFRQQELEGLSPLDHGAQTPELQRMFGSLDKTIYTLIQATLGGVSWGVASDALLDIHLGYGLLFFFYIAFTILAVLNIITGVFVDNAIETTQTQREFLIQKEMDVKQHYITELRSLFDEMDGDDNGTVTWNELKDYLEDLRVMSYFQALGLDPNDAERLFKLLDDDDSGDISINEFLAGCLRLKGQARSIDIHAISHDLKKLMARLDRMESNSCKASECNSVLKLAQHRPGRATPLSGGSFTL